MAPGEDPACSEVAELGLEPKSVDPKSVLLKPSVFPGPEEAQNFQLNS